MGYADDEAKREDKRAKAREYARQYRERNREMLAAKQRAYAASHPEEIKASNKRRYYADPAADNARSRAWRENNKERKRQMDQQYRATNSENLRLYDRARSRTEGRREQNRRSYAANAQKRRAYDRSRSSRGIFERHGLRPEQLAELIATQGGACCYCRRPLPADPRRIHIDHDHSHCPSGRSCTTCRRGVACQACNHIVGLAKDDAEVLAAIAANATAILAEARQRIAAVEPAFLDALSTDAQGAIDEAESESMPDLDMPVGTSWPDVSGALW